MMRRREQSGMMRYKQTASQAFDETYRFLGDILYPDLLYSKNRTISFNTHKKRGSEFKGTFNYKQWGDDMTGDIF